eukprot:2262186-Pleurochrysis_carterae.AAC.1
MKQKTATEAAVMPSAGEARRTCSAVPSPSSASVSPAEPTSSSGRRPVAPHAPLTTNRRKVANARVHDWNCRDKTVRTRHVSHATRSGEDMRRPGRFASDPVRTAQVLIAGAEKRGRSSRQFR